jgi:uncharacterized hydrophobic protein (TIGR00271 family)
MTEPSTGTITLTTRPLGEPARPVSPPPIRSRPFTRLVTLLGRAELGALSDTDRDRIMRGLFHEGDRFGRFARRFAALMTLSVLIAVMGLLADSTAVVIGAMLVAPLMTPVLAAAAALVMGWPKRVVQQLGLSMAGALGAIGLAAATSLAFPSSVDPLPSEIMARTSPNLLDLGIALAAGAAGAYAQIRRAAAGALTGVAVAVALVPPLAVVGICLQLGLFSLAAGAFLLFLANVIGIVMSASLTFLVCGLVSGRRMRAGSGLIAGGMRWAAIAVIIMILPLHVTRASVLPPTDPTDDIELSIDRFIHNVGGGTEMVSLSVNQDSAELLVDIVLTGTRLTPEAAELADHLANELAQPVSVRLQVLAVQTDRARAASGD